MANTTNQQRLAAALPFSETTLLTSLASAADAEAVAVPSAAVAEPSAAAVAGESSLLAVAAADTTISINPISIDNNIGYYEHGNATVISGYVNAGNPGDTVTVTLHGKSYSGPLGNDAVWYVTVPESDIAQIPNGKVAVSASYTDSTGELHQAGSQISLLAGAQTTSVPTLYLNKVTGDDVLSAVERGGDLLISGWGRNIGAGYEVTVTLNGHQYHATTTQDSRWAITVPQADVQALPDGNITLLASLGHETRVAEIAKTLTLNSNGEGSEAPQLTLDPVFGDDVVNSYEIGASQYITGHADHLAAGSTVKLTVGDKVFGGKVTSDGLWSVFTSGLYSLANGDTTHATISFQDPAGNQFAATRQIELQGRGYPYRYPMTFTLDPTSGDNHLSGAEKYQKLVISSSHSSGEGLGIGGTVEVLLNGKIYTTVAEAGPNGDGFDNYWQVTIPTGDVRALAPGSYTVIATLTDSVTQGGKEIAVRNVQAKIITVDDDGVATLSDSHAAQESSVHALAAETATRPAAPTDISLPAAPADMWQNLSTGSPIETHHADAVYPVAPTENTLADALQQQHLQPVV